MRNRSPADKASQRGRGRSNPQGCWTGEQLEDRMLLSGTGLDPSFGTNGVVELPSATILATTGDQASSALATVDFALVAISGPSVRGSDSVAAACASGLAPQVLTAASPSAATSGLGQSAVSLAQAAARRAMAATDTAIAAGVDPWTGLYSDID